MEDKKEISHITIQVNGEDKCRVPFEIGNSLINWKDAEDSLCYRDNVSIYCSKEEELMRKHQEKDEAFVDRNIKLQVKRKNNFLLSAINSGASKEALKIFSDRYFDFNDMERICVAYKSGMPEKYILKMIDLDTSSEVIAYIEAWQLYKNEDMLDVLANLNDYESMYVYMDAYGRKMKPENLKQLASIETTIAMCDYFKAYFMNMPQKHLNVMADSMLGHRRYMEAYFIGMPEEKLDILKNLFGEQFFFYYDAYVINMDDKNIERGLKCASCKLFIEAYKMKMIDKDLERLSHLPFQKMDIYFKARIGSFDEDAMDELYKISMSKIPYITPEEFYENYRQNRSDLDYIKKELSEKYKEYDEEFIKEIFKTEESYK